MLAYELFLEQLPFEAETAAEVMTMHLRAQPPEPRELWPEIPHLLEKLLLQMLAKKPEQRPSMVTVAATLEQVRDELAARRRGFVTEPVVIQPRHPRARTSAPALAATQLAGRRFGRAWRVLAGALALCAAAAMFGLAHDSARDRGRAHEQRRSASSTPSSRTSRRLSRPRCRRRSCRSHRRCRPRRPS